MGTTIKVLDENQIPFVLISLPAMAKVQQYVSQCNLEVGWMGLVSKFETEEGVPYLALHDPYAPAQEVAPTTTDLDATGKGSFAEWAMGLGEQAPLVKWWGHSHVNMGVTPSGTDLKTFYEHIENDPDNPFVMTVHNKKGEKYCNLYLGGGVYVENTPLLINYATETIIEEVAAELKQNVRRKTYAVQPYQANGHYSGKPASIAGSPHSGSGSSGEQPDKSDRKKRNAESNALGLRRGGKSQPAKSSVRRKGRGKKQGKGNAGDRAA